MNKHIFSSVAAWILPSILGGALAFFGVAFGYRYYLLAQELAAVREELASSARAHEIKTKRFTDELTVAKHENAELNDAVRAQNERLEALAGQVQEVAGTAGTLEKLSKTDRELLKKYSKIYFLNENYVPAGLVGIDPKYLNNKEKLEQIHASVQPFLTALLDEAARSGNTIEIISAYRSFGVQSSLKSGYRFTYGAGTANAFSADQGYSEHQLGITVDVTTPDLGATFEGFGKTAAYAWLKENAHRYGFILSYSEKNAYYTFEPWHWRFVGIELATILHVEGKYFYDLDQRSIDPYLVKIFDP
jgi:D-alanyl-D-alanine carboxypeptidase